VLRRSLAILVLLCLIVSACTAEGSEPIAENPERQGPQGSILPPAETDPDFGGEDLPEEVPEENPDDGRLVVQDNNAQLYTMLPDGDEVAELTDPGTINTQASWAPDGSRVAWVARDATTGEASIAADRFDRSDFRSVDVEIPPFYLYWDPSAALIAHLGPSQGGIDLGVAGLAVLLGVGSRR